MTEHANTAGGTAVATPPTAMATRDLIDTAIADGHFKTLVKAVGVADLLGTLKGKGPFTIFAPVDAAFDVLPKGTVESLLKDIPKLSRILSFHVVAGQHTLADLKKMADKSGKIEVKTVQGQNLHLKIEGVTVHAGADSKAIVTRPDVTGNNGVMHVIDSVLMPTM
jgi:uncharacterized surface protein with fasciclin (FAS1) repeats